MNHIPSFDEYLNESFHRLPKQTIGNTLYMAKQSLNSFYDRVDAGNDVDPAVLKSIINRLQKVEKEIKSFNKADDIKGTVYESEMNEKNKGGWVNTQIYRKSDKKEFTVNDFENYGSYQELFAKSKDGEEVEVTLGRPNSKNDFFQNWQTGKP
jgi:hypothetical protein